MSRRSGDGRVQRAGIKRQYQPIRPLLSNLPSPPEGTKWCSETNKQISIAGRCHDFDLNKPSAIDVMDPHTSCVACRKDGARRKRLGRTARLVEDGAVCSNGLLHSMDASRGFGYCDECEMVRRDVKQRKLREATVQRAETVRQQAALVRIPRRVLVPSSPLLRRLCPPTWLPSDILPSDLSDARRGLIVLDTPVRNNLTAWDAMQTRMQGRSTELRECDDDINEPLPPPPPPPPAPVLVPEAPIAKAPPAHHQLVDLPTYIRANTVWAVDAPGPPARPAILPMHNSLLYATPTPSTWSSTARGLATRHLKFLGLTSASRQVSTPAVPQLTSCMRGRPIADACAASTADRSSTCGTAGHDDGVDLQLECNALDDHDHDHETIPLQLTDLEQAYKDRLWRGWRRRAAVHAAGGSDFVSDTTIDS